MKRKKTESYAKKVNKVKLKVRSDISLFEWGKFKYCDKDFTTSNSIVTRIKNNQYSEEQFEKKIELASIPVVIEGVVTKDRWPAGEKWTQENFLKQYSHCKFKVGESDSGNSAYLKYKYLKTTY